MIFIFNIIIIAIVIIKKLITFFDCRVSEALLFGTWVLSNALAYSPNINSAFDSAARILQLIDSSDVEKKPNNNVAAKNDWVRLVFLTVAGIFHKVLLFLDR